MRNGLQPSGHSSKPACTKWRSKPKARAMPWRRMRAKDTGSRGAGTGSTRTPRSPTPPCSKAPRPPTSQESVLVGVCEESGAVLVVPAQSAPRLKEAREIVKEETFPVRLPAQLIDVLCLLADHFDVGTKKFLPALIRFYLAEAVQDRRLAKRLARLAGRRVALEGRKSRITLRTDAHLLERVDRVASELDGVSRSDLVRGAVLAAKEDVLAGRAARRAETLRAVARAV